VERWDFDTSPLSVFILLYIGGRVPQDHSDGWDGMGLAVRRMKGRQAAIDWWYGIRLLAQSTTKKYSFVFRATNGGPIGIFRQACLAFYFVSLGRRCYVVPGPS